MKPCYAAHRKTFVRPTYFQRALDWLHDHYQFLLTDPKRLAFPQNQFPALFKTCPTQYKAELHAWEVQNPGLPSDRDWDLAIKAFLQECLTKAQGKQAPGHTLSMSRALKA